MGLLDDLSMGLGLKDRDEDYYNRTAETLGGARGEQYRQSSGFNKLGRQGLLSGSSMGKYRDMNDMFDGGGPMARGGQYEGGGLISFLANLANAVAGRDMGDKVGYGAPTKATMKPKSRVMPSPETANGYYPEMPVMPDGASSASNQFIPEMPVAPSMSNTAKTTQLPLENLQVPESNISNMRLQTYNSLMLTVPSDASSENFQKYADDILYDITRLPYNEWLRLQ